MNPDLKKRIEAEAKELCKAYGSPDCGWTTRAMLDMAVVVDRYWRERIEATKKRDWPERNEDAEEMHNEGRESIRRELLSTKSAEERSDSGDEEKKNENN